MFTYAELVAGKQRIMDEICLKMAFKLIDPNEKSFDPVTYYNSAKKTRCNKYITAVDESGINTFTKWFYGVKSAYQYLDGIMTD